MDKTRLDELRKVPLFNGLSDPELELVASGLKEKAFLKGERLFTEGAFCERIFIVREGRVKFYRSSATGREQILGILKGGDSCACNPGEVEWFCSSTAEALTDCKVWYLSRHDYLEMVKRSATVARTLNHLFAERMKCLSSLVEEVSLKDVKKRLIKFLLDMLSESAPPARGAGKTLFIPFTREEIAQRLGTARETVARYLSQLKDDGLIDIRPYQITILDRKRLEELLR